MGLLRRNFLQLAAVAAALPAMPRLATALDYPTRPVRIIVGFPPGGPQDIFARLIGDRLSERFGQQFIVENRTGAGGNIGAEYVITAAPDGYTLLIVGPPNAINATLYENLHFNFIRDIAPIAGLARSPNVLDLNLNVPARSVPEFIAYAKANAGKINAASGGNGSLPHLALVLFNMMAGVNLVHVPYRGEQTAIPDLINDRIQVEFGSITWSIEYFKAGKTRALAVTTATTSPLLPGVPALAEFVPGYEASGWYGIGAPKKTSGEIIHKLNAEINAALADPTLRARLAAVGGTPLELSPAEFTKLIADETEKWAKVIRTANIKPE